MLLVPTFRVATCALAILTILAMASAVLVWRLNFFGLVFFIFSIYHPFLRSRLVLKRNWVEQKTFFQKSNSMVASLSLFFFLIFYPLYCCSRFFCFFFAHSHSLDLSRSFTLSCSFSRFCPFSLSRYFLSLSRSHARFHSFSLSRSFLLSHCHVI